MFHGHLDYFQKSLLGGRHNPTLGDCGTPTMTLEGPTEHVTARWMGKSTWIPTWHSMDRVSWSLGLILKTTA